MPGYLMNMMVLIETEDWLEKITETLGPRQKRSPLETKVFSLASQAKDYLRFNYDPALATEDFPEVSHTNIENNIGSGITQYAFMGAIGPDFPAAGNILALNQGWVAKTMHIGAPRRALETALTTTFVKNCIDGTTVQSAVQAVKGQAVSANKTLVAQYKKPLMAYLLGHLSSIATHVLVGPFVNQWAWGQDNADRLQFTVQLDAQIAKAYFQRDDLHSGQSWTTYLPDIGYFSHPTGIRLITELYQQGFRKTYRTTDKTNDKSDESDDINPRETLSNFPNDPSVKTALASIKNETLSGALQPYTGYANIIKGTKDEDHIVDVIGSIPGLKKLLTDWETKTPDIGPDPSDVNPDPPLLIDGYRNTRNWALGWGYDRSPSLPWPPWRFSIIMSLAALYGSIGPFLKLGVTEDVWDEVTDSSDKADAWVHGGMFANGSMWHDVLDNPYGVSGSLLWLFNSTLTGVQICDIWQTGKGTTPGRGADKGQAPGTEITWGIATGAALSGVELAGAGLDAGLGEGAGLAAAVGGVYSLIALLASQVKTTTAFVVEKDEQGNPKEVERKRRPLGRLTDGIFGEGTDGWKDWWLIRPGKWAFKLINFTKGPGFSPPVDGWLDFLDNLVDKVLPKASPYWTWISLGINITLDAIDTIYFEHEDRSKGQEGDRVQRQLWFMQWWMTGANFLSSLLVFGVKSADDTRNAPAAGTASTSGSSTTITLSDARMCAILSPGDFLTANGVTTRIASLSCASGTATTSTVTVTTPVNWPAGSTFTWTDGNLHARDYLLSLIFPALFIAFKVWYMGGFERELLKSIKGIDWPSTDTDKVDDKILPLTTANGRKVLTSAGAQPSPVRVFPKEVMKKVDIGDLKAKVCYPQDEAENIPWDDIPKRDDHERALKSKSTTQTYTLKDILDKAKFLSGLLAMVAVDYDNTNGKDPCIGNIFRDWNLDFRTEVEWNELMETRPDGTPGFAKAAQQWWEAVLKGADPDLPTLTTMKAVLCPPEESPVQISGQIEDRTVAPNNDKENTAHIFLANAPFEIVDADGNPKATGTTDKDGKFTFTPPDAADYELRVKDKNFVGIVWTNQGSC